MGFLPLILMIGEVFLLRGGVQVSGSISAYCHTSMRDMFVTGLCVIGFGAPPPPWSCESPHLTESAW